MARTTTLPLWRTISRVASLPPGSISRSRSTRKSGPSKTVSELSSSAFSSIAGRSALRAFFALGFFSAFAFLRAFFALGFFSAFAFLRAFFALGFFSAFAFLRAFFALGFFSAFFTFLMAFFALGFFSAFFTCLMAFFTLGLAAFFPLDLAAFAFLGLVALAAFFFFLDISCLSSIGAIDAHSDNMRNQIQSIRTARPFTAIKTYSCNDWVWRGILNRCRIPFSVRVDWVRPGTHDREENELLSAECHQIGRAHV